MQNKMEDGNMKTKFKHRVVAMTLAIMMTVAPVGGTVFAADEINADQNVKSVEASYEDNVKEDKQAEKAPEAGSGNESKEVSQAESSSEAGSESESKEAVQSDSPAEAGSENESSEISQPEKPEASSYEDNEKIEDYNRKVDEYNKAAETYNETVDKEYEAAVEEVNQKNAEIDQHNEAETRRVEEAEARNAQAVLDAAAANDEIDKANTEEKARVEEHNRAEDEKAEASAIARKAAEEENESIRAYNEEAAKAAEKYAEDYAKYEADSKQYEYDVEMEKRILNAGYASVQDYNDRINKAYNEPAEKSKTMNASTEIKSVSDTYKVTEAEDKSGVNVSVIVKHIFDGTDVSYTDEFSIDANDMIVLNSIGALGSATSPGYASFYYKTDEAHSIGYWYEGYSELQTTARHSEYGWNCGDEHEITYREGKSHPFDEEVIEMTYYYYWNPLRTARTYNVPTAPVKPEEPGAAKDLVEVPELYTPEYREFVERPHIEAELEDIEEANIIERIASPIKRAYIALLGYMDLFDVPVKEAAEEAAPAEEVIPAEEIPAPAAEVKEETPAPAAPAAEEAAPAPEAEGKEDTAPAAEAVEEAAPAPAAEVKETPIADIIEEIPAAVIEEAPAPAAVIEKETPAPAAATAEEVKTAEAIPAAATAEKTRKAEAAPARSTQTAAAEEVQIAEAAQVAKAAPATMIADKDIPMAGVEENSYWALLNLIMTILTGIISAVLLVGYFGRKEDDEENDDENEDKTNRKGFTRVMSLIPAVGAAIIFILTENMNNPMILTDRWTILMAVILLIQAIVAIFAKKSEDEDEDEEIAEAVNA